MKADVRAVIAARGKQAADARPVAPEARGGEMMAAKAVAKSRYVLRDAGILLEHARSSCSRDDEKPMRSHAHVAEEIEKRDTMACIAENGMKLGRRHYLLAILRRGGRRIWLCSSARR